jgi:hypothetical protein
MSASTRLSAVQVLIEIGDRLTGTMVLHHITPTTAS